MDPFERGFEFLRERILKKLYIMNYLKTKLKDYY